MIARYSRPEMAAVWAEEAKLRLWLQIELLVCEALARLGWIPAEVPETIQQKVQLRPERIAELEQTLRHDVIAFLSSLAEQLGPEGRYVHFGLTSSDVVDTALAVQLKQAGEILLRDLAQFEEVLRSRAQQFRYTPCVGRTHGVHAEPMTFGLKFLSWLQECRRNQERLRIAVESISYGKLSGTIGTYTQLPPEVEAYVCERLGLRPEPVATQVVPRDRHAHFLTVLALIAGMCERIAVEVRHLQRTEVREAEEAFATGQRGSSAMPHKRNPIHAERICGLARLVRSNALVALENIALWHERDISHSSAERVLLPDTTIVLDYIVGLAVELLESLQVYPERMAYNLELTHGLIYSQSVLLALVQRGMSRETAYAAVQQAAMKTWHTARHFRETLWEQPEVQACLQTPEVLDELFALAPLLRNIDHLFERCGLSAPAEVPEP
ncbi:MAG: adenylosuccinate lyase [Candidatus Kapabacteria bacterium]|nr:adenylosuccinate lyase [Candidatus Kapabacteria bacterium]